MKKRINDLLNGKIEYQPVTLEFSTPEITGQVQERENFRGKFSVRTAEGKSIQGFLHSTNLRVGFQPDSFVGTQETFRFEADTRGLRAPSVLTGEFVLSTTVGEYRLPYEIRVGGETDGLNGQEEAGRTVETAGREAAERTVEVAGREAAGRAVEAAGREATGRIVETVGREATEKTVEASGRKATERTGKAAGQEATERTGEAADREKPEGHDSRPAVPMSPEQFAELAKEDFAGAYLRFVSWQFLEWTAQWGGAFEALYRGLRAAAVTYASLEQFLTGEGLKEPCRLTVDSDHLLLENVKETTKEELAVHRNTWGFAMISVESDAEFLTPERPSLTTEEFVGNTCYVGFLIHREKLHAGRNFAKLTIRWGCEELTCTVEVRPERKRTPERQVRRQRRELAQILKDWTDCRNGRLSRNDWAERALQGLDRYRRAGGREILWDLYEIYILFQQTDTIQGELLLQQILDRKQELEEPAARACGLYLTSLQNQEDGWQEYVRKQIGELFLSNQENWILQLLMLRVNDRLFRNDTERLDCLRRQFLCGCKSPLLYQEAYRLLKKEPLLLRRLEAFEVHLLRYLCKEKLLDRELTGQMAQLAGRCQEFDPVLFRVMTDSFARYPTGNLLTAICGMLLRGRKREAKYAPWFLAGIKQDVRLTGLYEAYAETAGDLREQLLPQEVRMYFTLHNSLDASRKAAIYASLAGHRAQDPEAWESCRDEIQRFVEEQLGRGKISRDLALLYQTLLTEDVMTKPLARSLEQVLYSCEVTCSNPVFRQMIVVYRELEQEQRLQLNGQKACVQIYGPDYAILGEDRNGNRFDARRWCRVERFLPGDEFENLCRKILEEPVQVTPDLSAEPLPGSELPHETEPVGNSSVEASPGSVFPHVTGSAGKLSLEPASVLLLHDYICQGAEQEITKANVETAIRLLCAQALRRDCRIRIRRRLMEYFASQPKAEQKDDARLLAFLERIDCQETMRDQKRETAVLLALTDQYERLLELIRTVGPEEIDPAILVRMCSSCIIAREYEKDDFLLAVSARCFCGGVYDEQMLRYLMRHYEGPLETMKSVWYAGTAFGLESCELEERILVLVLFLLQGMERTEAIFASYEKRPGKGKICRAYVTLMCYQYFVREQEIGSQVFQYVERSMLGNVSTPDVCRLALLRYYVGVKRKTAGQKKWMLYLLQSYVGNGMRFAFLQRLPEKVKIRFHLEDKVILEYRTDPKAEVTLHFRYRGQPEQSVMLQQTFEGIFTREFTLFYQDTLEWYFTVKRPVRPTGRYGTLWKQPSAEPAMRIQNGYAYLETEKKQMTMNRQTGRGSDSRYDLINRMIDAQSRGNEQKYIELRSRYDGREYLTEILFPLNE